MAAQVQIDVNRLASFCQMHAIRKIGLFGSVLRNDFSPASDVDVLVEFAPGRTPGLRFLEIRDELSRMFHRPVDLLTFQAVQRMRNPIRRQAILNQHEIIYDTTGA